MHGRFTFCCRGLARVQAASLPARRSELENLANFIAKKREIFLVQMALSIKTAEMKRLAERTAQANLASYVNAS